MMGLDIVEIFMDIEDTFGIRISDREAQKCATVQDLYTTILAHLERDGIDPNYLRCLNCQYNLRGLERKTCPECGKPFTPPDEMRSDAVMRILTDILAKQLCMKPADIHPWQHLVKDLKIG